MAKQHEGVSPGGTTRQPRRKKRKEYIEEERKARSDAMKKRMDEKYGKPGEMTPTQKSAMEADIAKMLEPSPGKKKSVQERIDENRAEGKKRRGRHQYKK